jgi:hypothetical protein
MFAVVFVCCKCFAAWGLQDDQVKILAGFDAIYVIYSSLLSLLLLLSMISDNFLSKDLDFLQTRADPEHPFCRPKYDELSNCCQNLR